MSRFLVVLALLAASPLAVFPHDVSASPVSRVVTLAMDGEDDDNKNDHVQIRKDVGSIEGEVVSVDYRTSHFGVRAGNMVYDVTVLPSTDFRGRNNAFRGFTDIKKGTRVNVMLSQRAASYVAQIIRLH